MSKQSVISARVDAATLAQVDMVASAAGRSRAWFVAEAVRQAAAQETELLAVAQAGRADIAAGRTVANESVMAKLEARIAFFEAQCQR